MIFIDTKYYTLLKLLSYKKLGWPLLEPIEGLEARKLKSLAALVRIYSLMLGPCK